MGTYKKGILGFIRGRVGNVVGAVWNGIHYLKSLPDVSPDRKPTAAQLNQQLIFALVVGFLRPLKVLLNIGYQTFTKGTTPVNAATGYHLKHAITGVSPNYVIDYPKVVFSVGNLEEPQMAGVTTGGTAKIDFDWAGLVNADEGAATDRATFLVYNPTLKKYVSVRDVAARSSMAFSLTVPAAWIGHDVHCYMAFTSLDGKKVSNSVYVGGMPVI